MKLISLEQRSQDWIVWRKTGLGSSDAPVLWNGKHFSKTIDQLRLDKANSLLGLKVKEGRKNSAMQRGIDSEGSVLDRYREFSELDSGPCCGVHDDHDWMKASFDGLATRKGVTIPAEIKTCGIKHDGSSDHYDALDGRIPEKYLPQLDHQLLVAGSTLAHYVSYAPDFPRFDQFRVIVYNAPVERLLELLRIEREFWWEVHDLANLGAPLDVAETPSWVRSLPREGAVNSGR